MGVLQELDYTVKPANGVQRAMQNDQPTAFHHILFQRSSSAGIGAVETLSAHQNRDAMVNFRQLFGDLAV